MNSYRPFVAEFARLLRQGAALPLGGFSPPPRPKLSRGAPKVLLFSPHPDDEVITGALPLRLLREAGMAILNVAVTLGSNPARRAERRRELARCCGHIGFGVIETRKDGLASIHTDTRRRDRATWDAAVKCIARILRVHQPHIICFPHDHDWNRTHIGVHHLVVDALKTLGPAFACFTVETEFWGAMADPNLMVESSEQDVADLLTALSFHVGEVRRNPFHLRAPAWLIDNVRRGAELVGGQGAAAPNFAFATLYRLRRWQQGGFAKVLNHGKFVAVSDRVADLFRETEE